MDSSGLLEVRILNDQKFLLIRTNTRNLQDFGEDLEGLDLTSIAGWDLEAFWNF